MGKKRGNLRVRKGTAVYGPMSREDVVQLRDSGRFSDSDEVSVDEGPWLPLPKFLAGPVAEAPPPIPTAEPSSSVWKATTPSVSRRDRDPDACLRVLKEGKIYPPMTLKQVADLMAATRLSGENLIAAIDGPWMRLADFFAPPAPEQPPPPQQQPAATRGVVLEEIVEDELEEVVEEVLDVEVVAEGSQVFSPLAETDAFHKPGSVRVQFSDNWYLKIRGTHTLPIKRRHVKELLMAREAHAETPTRHVTWPDTRWMSLRENPDLSDLLKA